MARSGWNKNYPAVAGLEYVGVGSRSYLVQQPTDERVIRFTAQRTGALAEVVVYSGPNSNIPLLTSPDMYNRRSLPYIAEVMTRAAYDTHQHSAFVNFADAAAISGTTQIQNENGSAASVDRLTFPNDGLYFKRVATTGDHHVDVSFDDLNLTGQQILNVGIDYRLAGVWPLVYRRGDGNVVGSTKWVQLAPAGQGLLNMGEVWLENTDLTHWHEVTPTMLRQFNSGIGNRRVRVQHTGTSTFQWDWLRLHVTYTPERRLGMGILDVSTIPYKDKWLVIPIHSPGATGAPNVTAGQEYVITLRPAYLQGAYGVSGTLDLRAIADRTGAHFYDLDWDGHSSTFVATSMPGDIIQPPLDGVIALRTTNGSTYQDDSQGYEYTTGAVVGQGSDARQVTIPTSTSAKYGLVKAVLSVSQAPTQDLAVTVRHGTTKAIIAGPVIVPVEQLDNAGVVGIDDFGNTYKEVFVDLSGDYTLPATTDLQFSSTSPTGTPWLVATAWTALTFGTDVTFGGGSSYATGSAVSPVDGTLSPLNVGGGLTGADLEAVVMTRPPPVTGSPVVVADQPLTGGSCKICPQDAGCAVTGIPLAFVFWTSSPVTGFGYYEVQRSDDGSLTWATVDKHAPASANSFIDYTMPFGRPVRYRVRVVTAAGATSNWSNEMIVTVAAPAGTGIVITSPTDPTLNVAYPSIHGEKLPVESAYSLLDGGDTVLMAIYGRDNQLAFRPTERLGFRFTRQLMPAAFCSGRYCVDVVEPLRDLMNQPYLVMRDDQGCAFFVSIDVGGITKVTDKTLGSYWLVDVTFTETVTPDVVVATL